MTDSIFPTNDQGPDTAAPSAGPPNQAPGWVAYHDLLIDRLRRWLIYAYAPPGGSGDQQPSVAADSDHPLNSDQAPTNVGLYRVIEELTALRHELKLQTRSARGAVEESAQARDAMKAAADRFDALRNQEQTRQTAALRDAAKSMIETLADLDETLSRGLTELARARTRIVQDAVAEAEQELQAIFSRKGWFGGGVSNRARQQVSNLLRKQAEQGHGRILDSLAEGFGLVQSRLHREMQAQDLQRIETLGLPFDPHQMTAIDTVESADVDAGAIAEEVRPGYLWRGNLFRPAEVRVAK